MNSPFRLLIPIAIGAALGLGPGLLHAGGQPHEHGVTHLEVVADGSTLAINLHGAGYHLVGFEHAPEDEEQRAAWADTRERLADAVALFAPSPGARCRAEDARVEAPDGGDAVVEAGHGADAHAGSGHAGGHGHDSGHDHGHGHTHDESHAHGHDDDHHAHDHGDDHAHDHGGHTSDWSAHYRFSCEEPARLEYIDIGLFDAFPAHAEVRYQRLSDNGQSGGTLTPGNTRLRMR